MKQAIFLAVVLIFIAGCATVENTSQTNNVTINGTSELIFTEQDLKELGMAAEVDDQVLNQLGIGLNGENCRTDNEYTNIVDSNYGQYSVCAYVIPSLNNTQVIIELQKFADSEALVGSYQYSSSHLNSAEGIISENKYGDMSKFYKNNPNDYGGQLDPPGMHFYHLWFTKGLYMVHVTSAGTSIDADEYVLDAGTKILSKFG